MLKVNHKQAKISGYVYYAPEGTGTKPVMQTHKFIPGMNEVDNEVWNLIWKEVKRAQGVDVYDALIDSFEILHDDTKAKKAFDPMGLGKKELLSYVQAEMELEPLLKLRLDIKRLKKKRDNQLIQALNGKIEEIEMLDKVYLSQKG